MIEDEKYRFKDNILYQYDEELKSFVELFRLAPITQEEAEQFCRDKGLI